MIKFHKDILKSKDNGMPFNYMGRQSSILNGSGKRKYLTEEELYDFINAASEFDQKSYLFCRIMAATGCRISEALALTVRDFDFDSGVVVLECLKKRKRGVFREVPLSPGLIRLMQEWFDQANLTPDSRIWPWCRMTGYRHICAVMERAGLDGEHATPKGLRHGFAILAIQSGVPLNMVQRWLGHADMSTTAIYANAMGPEERAIAARMWREEFDCTSHRLYPDAAARTNTRALAEAGKVIPIRPKPEFDPTTEILRIIGSALEGRATNSINSLFKNLKEKEIV